MWTGTENTKWDVCLEKTNIECKNFLVFATIAGTLSSFTEWVTALQTGSKRDCEHINRWDIMLLYL